MFRFSKKKMYAVEAVLDVAYYGKTSAIQAREITARQNIPPRYLEQVLQHLVRKNILKGVRGPRGGYLLGRPADKISIGEIVSVVRTVDARGGNPLPEVVSELGIGVVQPLAMVINDELFERLNAVTIADLMEDARKKGLSEQGEASSAA